MGTREEEEKSVPDSQNEMLSVMSRVVKVSLHGGQVISWRNERGEELLFTSNKGSLQLLISLFSMPHHLEIHWFSIINSCVTVLLLTGFLATILMRVLKNDFIKYSHDEESADDQEESGWKYIHGDVFRFPKHKSLFSVVLGSGTQLLALSVLCEGSTGVFIFGYCLYYYNARSDMSGFMQTSFFFGYMACICYGFFLMLGTVGFRVSLLFARHIYRSIKY